MSWDTAEVVVREEVDLGLLAPELRLVLTAVEEGALAAALPAAPHRRLVAVAFRLRARVAEERPDRAAVAQLLDEFVLLTIVGRTAVDDLHLLVLELRLDGTGEIEGRHGNEHD